MEQLPYTLQQTPLSFESGILQKVLFASALRETEREHGDDAEVLKCRGAVVKLKKSGKKRKEATGSVLRRKPACHRAAFLSCLPPKTRFW